MWDEALVSFLFTQTRVNYSHKGCMPASLAAKSRPALQDPIDYSLSGSSIRFSRQEYWNGLPFPPPRVFPSPGIEPRSPALPVDSLPSEPQGKPWACCTPSINEPGERKEDLTTGRIDVMKGSLGDKEGAAREARGQAGVRVQRQSQGKVSGRSTKAGAPVG